MEKIKPRKPFHIINYVIDVGNKDGYISDDEGYENDNLRNSLGSVDIRDVVDLLQNI